MRSTHIAVVRRTGYIQDEGIRDADLARVVQESSAAPEVVHQHVATLRFLCSGVRCAAVGTCLDMLARMNRDFRS